MDVEAEIRDLKRRVGDLEGALNVLTGHLKDVRPELAALRNQSSEGLRDLKGAVSDVDRRLGGVELQVWSLRDDLPEIVRSAVVRATASAGRGDKPAG